MTSLFFHLLVFIQIVFSTSLTPLGPTQVQNELERLVRDPGLAESKPNLQYASNAGALDYRNPEDLFFSLSKLPLSLQQVVTLVEIAQERENIRKMTLSDLSSWTFPVPRIYANYWCPDKSKLITIDIMTERLDDIAEMLAPSDGNSTVESVFWLHANSCKPIIWTQKSSRPDTAEFVPYEVDMCRAAKIRRIGEHIEFFTTHIPCHHNAFVLCFSY